jgi:hypothetical protein
MCVSDVSGFGFGTVFIVRCDACGKEKRGFSHFLTVATGDEKLHICRACFEQRPLAELFGAVPE